jgi:hypothetical protein
MEWNDFDGDGVGDNSDVDPDNPQVWEEEEEKEEEEEEEEEKEEEESPSEGKEEVYNEASLPPRSGWIDSDGERTHTEEYHLQEYYIYKIQFSIFINDSNEENAESDEGSPPDTVKATVASGEYSEDKEGETPFYFEVICESSSFLPNDWTVTIEGIEFGSGKPMGVVGMVVYVDQGIAWKILVDYVYVTYE